MKTEIKISGNIIGELSEKIPTNIIALNELIKNSYDAGATAVTIELNTRKKLLSIKDDGSGMDKKDIDILFHISKSNKKHGQKNEHGRITQGSKGLGFLSVFRFGKFVEWKTKKRKGFKFSVDYNKLTSTNDISHYPIELLDDDSISKGTEIIIDIDKYNTDSLKEYFLHEKNCKKIINSFDDNKFIIILKVDDEKYSSKNKLPLLDNEKKQQLFYITYNSKEQKIVFKHNNHVASTEPYNFDTTKFTLDIELVIFQFKSHGKDKIDKLFLNPSNDLVPLIYFNTNLFNNYTIFDPNIMRNIKTSQVLNQMIGVIRITSKNSLIDFNSDRSQFLQNELTDSIVNFLYNINKKIQEIGSGMKNYLVKFDFLTQNEITSDYSGFKTPEEYRTLIKNDFFFKRKVKIAVHDDNVTYSLFGRTETLQINANLPSSDSKDKKTKKTLVTAKIILNCNEKELPIASGQKDLKEYVNSIYNSDGVLIDKNNLIIKVNNEIVPDGILSSEEVPCEKSIIFSYLDQKTGPVAESLKIRFVVPIALITAKKKATPLLVIPSRKNYNLNLSQYLSNLIIQINNLEVNKNKEIIACSLRGLFELSIDCINKSDEYPSLFNGINELDKRVVKVIEYIKSKKKYISAISNSTKIDYGSLENFLNIEEYSSIITKSHLGSHKSTLYIEEPDIRKIAL